MNLRPVRGRGEPVYFPPMRPTTYLPGTNPINDGWNGRRRRIDGRNQADPAVAAGMRGIHRDTRGNVIGGYTAEGQGIGTKGGNWRGGEGMPPEAPVAPVTTTAAPVNPAATPVGQKRSWRDGGVRGTIGAELGTTPTATGGGLWRWRAMNQDAPAAFAAGSPANTKAQNRRLWKEAGLAARPENGAEGPSMPKSPLAFDESAMPTDGNGKPKRRSV